MFLRAVALSVLALAAMSPVTPAIAQEAAAQQSGPWVFTVEGGAFYQTSTDMDSGGDFDVARWYVQPSIGYAWDRRTSISLTIGGGETYYGFPSAAGLGGGDPWGTIRDLDISVPIRFSPMEEMDVFIIPAVRSHAERGADLDDGRTEGVLAGFMWRFSKNFAVGPGASWFTEIDGGSTFVPILLIDWNITDTLRLSTGRYIAVSRGPGLTLSWQAQEDLTVGVYGRYETNTFRLDDSGPAPNGIGTDDSIPVAAFVQFRPWPMATVSGFAGVRFAGEMELQNGNGNTIDSTDYDPAPMFGVAFSMRF